MEPPPEPVPRSDTATGEDGRNPRASARGACQSSKTVDRLIKDSRRFAERTEADQDFRSVQQTVAEDVPVLPLWQAKEYVVTTEDVGGGQYLSDGTGVFRLWGLTGL
ncbi:hypothetical protein ACIQXA_11735 [Streptomyces massasporeus]|uniref:hypothetical protein n=1 Tax=Streptomyces massasporeus TaxID=67324 RepID=UPI0037F7D4AF